jgi:hypothetical protein
MRAIKREHKNESNKTKVKKVRVRKAILVIDPVRKLNLLATEYEVATEYKVVNKK